MVTYDRVQYDDDDDDDDDDDVFLFPYLTKKTPMLN